jgi:hypothetical protein
VALGLVGFGDGAFVGADGAAPDRGDEDAGALRQCREAVAITGGLAGEDDPAAGPQHALEFGEGAVEVGPSPSAVAASCSSIPGEMSVAVSAPIVPRCIKFREK